MARCIQCGERKGKRFCPALESQICSRCCGTHRLREIDCPPDCPFVDSGEQYQDDKRLRRGVQRGREFLIRRGQVFPVRDEFAFVLAVEARVYLYARETPGVVDQDIRLSLEAIDNQLGRVVLPGGGSNRLVASILEEMGSHPEFQPFSHFSNEKRQRLIRRLARFIPKQAGSSGSARRYLESLDPYFGEVLDPRRSFGRHPSESDETRSRGGIIIP